MFCLPLSIKIHDGDEKIRQWDATCEETKDESHVARIIRDASQAAKLLAKSILVLRAAFFQLKHTLSGFAYRFWSTAMPKLNRFRTAKIEPLEGVSDENDKKLIAATLHAIEGYVMTAAIALGLLTSNLFTAFF